jgi:hypothetical protein
MEAWEEIEAAETEKKQIEAAMLVSILESGKVRSSPARCKVLAGGTEFPQRSKKEKAGPSSKQRDSG